MGLWMEILEEGKVIDFNWCLMLSVDILCFKVKVTYLEFKSDSEWQALRVFSSGA